MSTIMISDTTQNISYANTLNSVTKRETLNDSSEAWIQYLRDHRKLIREHSDHVTVELSTMIKYKYRPRKYLSSVNTSYVELRFDRQYRPVHQIHQILIYSLSIGQRGYTFWLQYCLNLNFLP